MAIEKIYLSPYLEPDDVMEKVNAATVNVTRASAVAEAALPVESDTFQMLLLTERTKLAGIEENAKGDQTGLEMRDLVVALADTERKIVITNPLTGEFKLVGVHRNAAGNLEYSYDDVPEA